MKTPRAWHPGGFTVGEMMVVLAMFSIVMGATLTASVSLQKSFAAVDSFFATHMQQIRIVDYLGRDVKRSLAVTTAIDPQTVTCVLPEYVIQPGDPDAGVNNANVNRRRDPVITLTANGPRVDYGRQVNDAGITNGSSTLTSATASFSAADVGAALNGANIPVGTTIQSVTNASTAVMSAKANLTRTNVQVAISRTRSIVYAVTNQEIRRTESGVPTIIASSTDRLIPETLDCDNNPNCQQDLAQANTEYTLSNVTFLPNFNFNGKGGAQQSQAEKDKEKIKRDGTAVYGKAYLRNRRRG
ncbi:MAG TPA: hypothetical protein VG095_00430 [Chthoniobacterales bacterium]|nr:hypothetical protein [Chthoniobacterales bacterium]